MSPAHVDIFLIIFCLDVELSLKNTKGQNEKLTEQVEWVVYILFLTLNQHVAIGLEIERAERQVGCDDAVVEDPVHIPGCLGPGTLLDTSARLALLEENQHILVSS